MFADLWWPKTLNCKLFTVLENLEISSNCKIVIHRSGEVMKVKHKFVWIKYNLKYVIDMSFLETRMDVSWKFVIPFLLNVLFIYIHLLFNTLFRRIIEVEEITWSMLFWLWRIFVIARALWKAMQTSHFENHSKLHASCVMFIVDRKMKLLTNRFRHSFIF